METKIIARVNNVDILSTSEEQLVAIKPICEALGIDRKRQQDKINCHPILSSVGGLKPLTGADGKIYEMYCLPLEYIFGWLFTINPANVNEDAKPALIKYQQECYHALFAYFTEPQTFLKQKQEVMEKKVTEYQECQRRFKDAQKLMNEAKTELNQVMKLTIEDWRANNRQLNLPFSTEEVTEE
jgi:hypothetical protein